MKGIDVKKKLQKSGFSLKNVADLINETPQNLNSMLNAQDIKTGVIEKIATAIKKSIYFFYEETGSEMLKKGQLQSPEASLEVGFYKEIIREKDLKIDELNQEIGALKHENKHLNGLLKKTEVINHMEDNTKTG
jgi:hypothetical protein